MLVAFGSGSTFGKVNHRYFKGRVPLTNGGACIAALYRAGATDRGFDTTSVTNASDLYPMLLRLREHA